MLLLFRGAYCLTKIKYFLKICKIGKFCHQMGYNMAEAGMRRNPAELGGVLMPQEKSCLKE